MSICIFAGSDSSLSDIATADGDSVSVTSSDSDSKTDSEEKTDPANTTTQTSAPKPAAVTTTLSREDSLVSIALDKCTLFVQSDNYIVLKDENDLETESVTVTPDADGSPVTVKCKNNQVTFEQDGKQITSFSYKGTIIELRNGSVYAGSKKLAYTDRSFNRAELTKDLTVVLSSGGNYTLRNASGDIINSSIISDDDGRLLTIMTSEDQTEMIVRNEKGTRIDSFRIGGKQIEIEDEMMLVDGNLLERAHSQDIVTSISTKAVQTESESETQDTEPTQQPSETEQSTTAEQTTSAAQTTSQAGQTTAASTTTKAATAATTRTTTAAATTTTKAATTTTKAATTTAATTKSSTSRLSLKPLKIPNHYTKIEDKTSEFLALLNPARQRQGLKALSANSAIAQAAKIRGEEYAAYPDLKHMRPSERGGGKYHTVFSDVIFDGRTGIPTYVTYTQAWDAGENLLNGWGTGASETTKQAFDKWMDSPIHKAHMFKSVYKNTAVYKITQQETINGATVTRYYWVQLFYSDLGSWAIK
jgi:uncharacterized protein YkwD